MVNFEYRLKYRWSLTTAWQFDDMPSYEVAVDTRDYWLPQHPGAECVLQRRQILPWKDVNTDTEELYAKVANSEQIRQGAIDELAEEL